MYNFDEIVKRKGTNSVKWDTIKETFNREDLIPLWVADMDFRCGYFIQDAIEKKLKEGVFGYSFIPESYYEAIIAWNKKRHNIELKKEWILFAPTVVQGILFSLKAITEEGDEVILQTPVYHRFFDIVENSGCRLVENPLTYKEGKYYMDFEDLENKITDKTKAIILCSPHNPVGRVWSSDELNKLHEICLRHNVKIISDEIHSDLVFRKKEYVSLLNISKDIKENFIVATAPTKTFNLAGFQVSNLIIPNDELREKVSSELEKHFVSKPNIFATTALESAYNEGEEYLEEMLVYLEDNKDYAIEFFKKHIPEIKAIESEGTYLLWLDCSSLNLSHKELEEFFIKECRIVLNSGTIFGKSGSGFMRMNIGCSRDLLSKALNNIYRALNSI